MNSDWAKFELFEGHEGGHGTPTLRVNLRSWARPPNATGDESLFLLTANAIDTDEFCAYVDELIDELQSLKVTAEKRFKKLKR
jgi:hypothetical protein